MPTHQSGILNFSKLTITPLYRCNYRCRSCLLGDQIHSNETLKYDEMEKVIDSIIEMNLANVVSFTGGEPFLVYELMLQISEYSWNKYQIGFSVTTNSYWAKDVSVTRNKLKPLYEFGLRWILLSWDDFHAQFGKIEHISNVINVCSELGIEPTLQNVYIKNSSRINSISKILSELCDVSLVKWVESPCIPIGFGTSIDHELMPFMNIDDLPYGYCSAGFILNIQPNGDVKPCCGAGLTAQRLTIGNIRIDKLDKIIRRASVDPIINSLVAFRGPKYLIYKIKKLGRYDLIPNSVVDTCDACYKILTNPKALILLQNSLEEEREYLLLSRVACEEFGIF